MPSSVRDPRREGVERNFALVAGAAAALGNVPELLSAVQLATQGPDERATLLYAAFLCRALLEASADDRAAMTLQCAWRAHRARQPGDCSWRRLSRSLGCPAAANRQRIRSSSPPENNMVTRAVNVWRCIKAMSHACSMDGQLSHSMLPSAGFARQQLHAWAAAARAISLVYRRRLDRRALVTSLAAIRRGLAAAVRVQALWRARRPRREYQRLLHAVQRCQVWPFVIIRSRDGVASSASSAGGTPQAAAFGCTDCMRPCQ